MDEQETGRGRRRKEKQKQSKSKSTQEAGRREGKKSIQEKIAHVVYPVPEHRVGMSCTP